MPKKTYPGSLNEPLKAPPTPLGTQDYNAAIQKYHEEIDNRLTLLMEFYQIDTVSATKWEQLACRLAQDHVPGLRKWTPDIDPDRHVRIFFRVLYLTQIRGFSEIGAAKAVSKLCPDLGNADAIRSTFREQEAHPKLKHFRNFFSRLQHSLSAEKLEDALAYAIGQDFVSLSTVDKPRRGRPPKK